MKNTSLKLFLYRTLDVDEDGDPYDHGNMRAADFESATILLQEHLAEFNVPLHVRIYEMHDQESAGVLGSEDEGYRDFHVNREPAT